MANFQHDTFLKYDDYMTPKYAWENIQHLIPKDKLIWEAFYGDGKSGTFLKELGFNIIHEQVDFFENNLGDIVISNPPFSKTKEVLTRLKNLDKPFILILPSSKINTQYVRQLFKDNDLQIIIPKSRIHFNKYIEGKPTDNFKSSCNFDCFYYCWKMDLPKHIIWI
jgi:hypothetical protein